VYAYLRRLVTAGAAYQVSDIVAKTLAVGTLPLYTRHVTRGSYGTAETLVTIVILTSIFLRFGVGEGFIRFYFADTDPERQTRLARAATGFVALVSTVCALLALAFAGPLSDLVLGFRDATLMGFAILGLWAFTNLEVAYALLRVDERRGAYVAASVTNVLLTVALTVFLVVIHDYEARGLVAGNFVASSVVLLGLWWALRARIGLPRVGAGIRARVAAAREELRPLVRFGLPTVPADASVFALNVVDRAYLYRVESHTAAGLYSLSVKLATVVIIAVRGFQYAWPPLAYSIEDDREAARVYATVATYYALVAGIVVAGVTLIGRWAVRLLAAPSYFPAHEALPWVALGWALYGFFLVFVVIAGRAKVTTRNFPAAIAGLAVNVVLLVLLVPSLDIRGAGIALCGAYMVMLVAIYLLTRRLFEVGFEWGRLAHIALVLVPGTVLAEILLPTSGAGGLLSRLAVVAALPFGLLVTGFFSPGELARARLLAGRMRARAAATRSAG
jgi:O-antigen/teichoic acid export membrane protein